MPPTKLARLTPDVLKRETDRSIHLYGGLAFGEMLVLTITRIADIGRESAGTGPCRPAGAGGAGRPRRRSACRAGPGAGTPSPGRPRQPPAGLRRPCSRPVAPHPMCRRDPRRRAHQLSAVRDLRGCRARRLRHRRGPGDRRPPGRPAGVGAGRAATRIAALVEGEADLVVATMGHNTQRDAQARFIRPHYYRSETIIVGPRDTMVRDWNDLRRSLHLRHRRQLRQLPTRLARRAAAVVRRRQQTAARPGGRDLPPRGAG